MRLSRSKVGGLLLGSVLAGLAAEGEGLKLFRNAVQFFK